MKIALTLSTLVLATATACGADAAGPTAEPTLVKGAQKGGTLTIGIPFDNPGLGFYEDGAYSGFEVETATYVAKALGVAEDDITWVEAQPQDREKLLTSGQVDLVFSTYSITDERQQVVDFAGPYFVAHQDLLVRRNETEITGPQTLNNRVLCSVTGTTSSAYVTEHFKGRIELEEYDVYSECVEALMDSEVDAVTTDDVILAGFAADERYRGRLKVVGDGFTDEAYGVGVPEGDTELVEQVNAALHQYVDDGSWEKALEATVGPSGYEIPDPPTLGQ
jgi:glutamate transport system substrate-binding protein